MNKYRVLLVDDEAPIRAVCRRILGGIALTLVEASSVEEARRQIADGSYDLLISDLRLQDGNGREVIEEFRQRFPSIPVLVMTGSPEENGNQRIRELEVDGLLPKPFDIHEMRRRISELLEGNSCGSP